MAPRAPPPRLEGAEDLQGEPADDAGSQVGRWLRSNDLQIDVAPEEKAQDEATLQYENYGFSEKRKYKYLNIPFDFDWHLYLHFNPDLRPHCKDKNEATIHYEKYGCKEKRQYTYKHVPYNFDWKLYLFL